MVGPNDAITQACSPEVGEAVNMLIARALRSCADLHLKSEGGAVSCIFKAACDKGERLPKDIAAGMFFRLKVLCFMEGGVCDRPQAGETELPIAGRKVVLRGRTTITVRGEELDIEILHVPASNDIWLQEALGMAKSERIAALASQLLMLSAQENAPVLIKPARGRITYVAAYHDGRCFTAIPTGDVPGLFARLLVMAGLDPAEEKHPQSGEIPLDRFSFRIETRLALRGIELFVSPVRQ